LLYSRDGPKGPYYIFLGVPHLAVHWLRGKVHTGTVVATSRYFASTSPTMTVKKST
jgi:hypothetical protein